MVMSRLSRTAAAGARRGGHMACSGADAVKFLQGFITNDVNSIKDGGALYAGWLNRKGRYMFDSIIARPNRATPLCEQDEFLLLCQKNSAASVERHIKLFKLRDKVTVKRDDSINIWSIMSTDTASLSSVVRDIDNGASDVDSIAFFDPRTPSADVLPPLGALVCTAAENSPNVPDNFEAVDEIVYQALRTIHGIGSDGTELIQDKSFILESNFDWLQGVSFNKGCYLGQELTARSHHTGIIRKRLMPVRFVPSDGTQEPKNKQKFPVERVEFEDGQIIPQFVDLTKPNHPSPGARIRGDTKRPIGSVLSAVGNIGIAQIRLANVVDAGAEGVAFDAEGYSVVPMVPSWWPQWPLELEDAP